MRRPLTAAIGLALLLLASGDAHAQWMPKGALAKVLVVNDCNETGADVAVTRLEPPTIYLCPRVMALVRRTNPGAEHFYLVHEYGHVALATTDEALADCWAAGQLAHARHGERYLAAAIEHFRQRRGNDSPRYGTSAARAERIRSCAEAARTNAVD
jgi:hypothetical protein